MVLRSCSRSFTTQPKAYSQSSTRTRFNRPSQCNTLFRSPRTIPTRSLSQTSRRSALPKKPSFLEAYKDTLDISFKSHLSLPLVLGQKLETHGFLGKIRKISSKLYFITLYSFWKGKRIEVQIISHRDVSKHAHALLTDIRPHSAVYVSGTLRRKRQVKEGESHKPSSSSAPQGNESSYNEDPGILACWKDVEIELEDIKCLADFPDDIIISEDARFPADQRHLQIRFDQDLQSRLMFRDIVLREVRSQMSDFQEVETPILFKSTPEGAREFLVPTRRPGYAYALPQSPQQYKQILMASGIPRYFQIAKCFRDEDLRADRQPEFTQIDLEMAFSNGQIVMQRVEELVIALYNALQPQNITTYKSLLKSPFPRMTYKMAMEKYGVDKPDLRIGGLIHRVEEILSPELVAKLTKLPNPIFECFKVHLDCDPQRARDFILKFMESPEGAPFRENPDGAPGVFIYDRRQPLEGMQAFGYEGVESLKGLFGGSSSEEFFESSIAKNPDKNFEEGDLLLVQARQRGPLFGGSTALGLLRNAIYKNAVLRGLVDQDSLHHYLWVTDFPLFTPDNETDPGQGGNAGFSATHHPFTAPKTTRDVDLLLTDPLMAIADHYDLVVNGVELGGGSRRIHNSDMQQFVMRDVLKMSKERLNDFSHLFEALRSGCPPHAGFALGLDRLIATMLGRDSVKDVIAFPKTGKGEDLLVKSPSLITKEQQKMYHLQIVE